MLCCRAPSQCNGCYSWFCWYHRHRWRHVCRRPCGCRGGGAGAGATPGVAVAARFPRPSPRVWRGGSVLRCRRARGPGGKCLLHLRAVPPPGHPPDGRLRMRAYEGRQRPPLHPTLQGNPMWLGPLECDLGGWDLGAKGAAVAAALKWHYPSGAVLCVLARNIGLRERRHPHTGRRRSSRYGWRGRAPRPASNPTATTTAPRMRFARPVRGPLAPPPRAASSTSRGSAPPRRGPVPTAWLWMRGGGPSITRWPVPPTRPTARGTARGRRRPTP